MPLKRGAAVAVGTFDGVHRGHRKVLEALVREAGKKGLEPTVLTFPEPPRNFFGAKTRLLCTLEKRVGLLKGLGIKRVEVMDFKKIHSLSPREFAKKILAKRLACRMIAAGPIFRFGKDREGGIETLKTLGKEFGFEVMEVALETLNGGKIGSTAIREALAAGDTGKAKSLLGYWPVLAGIAVKGHGEGRRLGFPTINIRPYPGLADIGSGIYAAALLFKKRAYPGAFYIGTRPTFSDTVKSFEIHILGTPPKIRHGDAAEAVIMGRIRGDMGFDGREALARAIEGDVKKVREYFQRPSFSKAYI